MSEPLKHIDDLFRKNQHQFDKKPSDAAWSRLDTMLDQVEDKEVVPKPRNNFRIWLSAAATVLLCLGAWWLSQSLLNTSEGVKTVAESKEVSRPMKTEVEAEAEMIEQVDKSVVLEDAVNESGAIENSDKLKKRAPTPQTTGDLNNAVVAESVQEKPILSKDEIVIDSEELAEELKQVVAVPDIVETTEADYSAESAEDDFVLQEETVLSENEEIEVEQESLNLEEIAVVPSSTTAPSTVESRAVQTFKIETSPIVAGKTAIPEIEWMEGVWIAENGRVVLEISRKDSKTYEVIWKEKGKAVRSIVIEEIDGNPLAIQVHQYNVNQTSYRFVLANANESFNTLQFNNDKGFVKLKSLVNGDLSWIEDSPFGQKMYMFKLQ